MRCELLKRRAIQLPSLLRLIGLLLPLSVQLELPQLAPQRRPSAPLQQRQRQRPARHSRRLCLTGQQASLPWLRCPAGHWQLEMVTVLWQTSCCVCWAWTWMAWHRQMDTPVVRLCLAAARVP